ncbi:lipoprotein-releasing system permease protein [Anseongella ginsenosidimutans]|uniref:Lipoprotein-releasing system permease protein n=1 Tax=Anseongella ginsenosidimutans TaxID=496056 RepID=A0A4R3KU04_9SPHI|nr:FtsX-like permease family protein [Anseongella ginsenosidimutans]QEC51523.1 ABC transporter permease [Anseongella ginsenosidimutans]TCS88837.1 lipoprotein-releasing system permease protein [Anseongella ginsenosidimutans]
MNFPFYIARRYLLSKKSTNAINIISLISVLGIFVGSAALLIILSVFNGFEGLVLSLFNTFSSDIRIEASEGKRFDPGATAAFDSIKNMPEVALYSETLEEKALLRYDRSQHIATLKGVSEDYLASHSFDSTIVKGKAVLRSDSLNYAIIGSGVEYYLGINVAGENDLPVSVFTPRRGRSAGLSLAPAGDFRQEEIYVSGVFAVQQEFDEKYALVPLRFIRNLLDEPRRVGAVELMLKEGTDTEAFKSGLREMLGKAFTVKDRYEQNALLHQLLNSEKWMVYIILTFVLLIAICNIIGSLTMLVIDKKKDIAVLFSMGASQRQVKKIFMAEGMLIALGGCLAGLLTGGIFCLVQKKYGLISMEGASFIDAYPVVLKAGDFLLVFATVFLIAFLASWFSTRQSLRNFGNIRDELAVQ